MKHRANVVFSALIFGAWASGVLPARAEIHAIHYQGQKEECLELTNGDARIVVAPANGGRIVHYSRKEGPNFFAGGWQVDLGPEIANPPRHSALWDGPCAVEKLGPLSLRLTSAKDSATSVQITKVIELATSGAGVTVRQSMKNIGDKEIAYCLWDRTMTQATYGFFELNPKSRFPARWSVREGKSHSYRYNGASPSSPRVKLLNNLLVIIPGVKMEKVGADSMAGWIAGYRDGWLYVKRFPVHPEGDYADGGNTVEFWVDAENTRMEIEPLSPNVPLKPGDTYSFIEQWDLLPTDIKINSAEDVPKLLPVVRKAAAVPMK